MAKVLTDTLSIDNDILEQDETLSAIKEEPTSNSPAYSLEVGRKLQQIVDDAQLIKRYPPSRYDVRDLLNLDLIGVCPDVKARAIFKIEKFVGGGFAGQVYRVKLIEIESNHHTGLKNLEAEQTYAIKILIPPSQFSLMFRNFVYWLAYQGPFAAQVFAEQKLEKENTRGLESIGDFLFRIIFLRCCWQMSYCFPSSEYEAMTQYFKFYIIEDDFNQ